MDDAKTPLPESEPARQAQLRSARIANAFHTVFGQPAGRTAAQCLVLEQLERQAGEGANSYQFNGARDGLAIIAAGIHRDGAKSQLLYIHRQISHAASLRAPAPRKAVNVKR